MQESINKSKDILLEEGITSSNFKDNIISSIIIQSEKVSKNVCSVSKVSKISRDSKIDKILTSKAFGIPIMICFLGIIFWITIAGANYPTKLLSEFFGFIEFKLLNLFNFLNSPGWLTGVLVNGAYKTLAWIVAVMLPPMAIFFPLFTILEDLRLSSKNCL